MRAPRASGSDAVVRDQHHCPPLGFVAGRPEVGTAADLLGRVGIDVWVVEESQAELVAQDAPRGLVDARFRDAPFLDELDEQLGQLLAAELVAAGVENAGQPVCRVELFDAPGLGLPGRSVGHRQVGDETPVGAHDAVEAEAAAEQAGDHLPVEAEPDGLELGADRTSVVGHDLRRSGGKGGLERLQVVFEAPAGVHLILAVGEMGILAVGLRAAARKMLEHAGDARRAELLALEAADVRGRQATDQLEVLAERAADACPARLGGHIGHRMQGDVDADGAVLLAGDLAEAAHELLVARRGEPDWLGPLGERARTTS